MRKFVLPVVLCFFAVPLFAATESYKDVSIVDSNCSKKVAGDPDTHTRSCALQCEKSGFGILTTDKKFIKFDSTGNADVIKALKSSDKKDHLRANVEGDLEGDTLKVKSITLL